MQRGRLCSQQSPNFNFLVLIMHSQVFQYVTAQSIYAAIIEFYQLVAQDKNQ